MSTWVDREKGPTCICGWPTFVIMMGEKPNLMCFGHTKAEGAMFRLPSKRPENWSTLTTEELGPVIEEGQKEFPFEEDEE